MAAGEDQSHGVAMKVSKWGNSLAVRLPADLVRALGLKAGDQVSLYADKGEVAARRPEEVLEGLNRFRGRLPASERLRRE